MFFVLRGQVRQVQLHVHVLGRIAGRQLHVMGQQLALQLVLGEHRRVVQVLRHVDGASTGAEGESPG